MSRHIFVLLTSFYLYFATTDIFANNLLDRFRWSGFLSVAGAITDHHGGDDNERSYLERIDEDGNFDDTHIGLNVFAHISESWNVAGQILMAGREKNYAAHADWVFSTYHFNDNASFLFGKIKYPNLLVSEIYDVGYAYPWIRAPQELYYLEPLGPNMSYEAFKGLSAVFSFITENDIEYTFQPYAGITPIESGQVEDMLGFMVSMGGDWFTIKAGYNHGEYDVTDIGDDEAELIPWVDAVHDVKKRVWNIGATFEWHNILGYTEYADYELARGAVFDTTSWYATLGYRMGNFLPHITYADMNQESKWGQKSITAGLRYDMNGSSAFKIEIQNISPIKRKNGIVSDSGTHELHPSGLFEHNPREGDITMLSISFDFVF